MNKKVELSVVVPVLGRIDDLDDLVSGYVDALEGLSTDYEMIFVVDGGVDEAFESLSKIAKASDRLSVVRLARYFGEATVLTAGFDQAKGDLVLTLPAYHQVEPGSLSRLLDEIDSCDVVVARRWPRAGGFFESLRRRTFHMLLKVLSGEDFNDLGCGVRLFRKQVVKEVHLYGDQHRFFPVLAGRYGFRVKEVDVAQSPKDHFRGRYRLREYLHRLLDIATVFFLVRFTKKPLRFFGMIGSAVVAVGGAVVLILVVQRLFFDIGLADRPALLLGSLMLVLGVQIFALGLIGELIIFTHAGSIKEYTIRTIVSKSGNGDGGDPSVRRLKVKGSV